MCSRSLLSFSAGGANTCTAFEHTKPLPTMSFFKFFPAFMLLGLSSTVNAAIGPITDLPIVNANIQPDGFTRPAVLAGGTFPGPIIKGNKVALGILLLARFIHSRISMCLRETTSKSMSSTN